MARVETLRAVTSLYDGQLTIPVEFRELLGIEDNAALEVTLCDGELRLKVFDAAKRAQEAGPLVALYEYFTPVRDEVRRLGVSDEELHAEIDAAVAEARAGRPDR